MNNFNKFLSIIILITLLLASVSTGCKPKLKNENKVIIAARTTPTPELVIEEKKIKPHRARFYQKLED